MAKKKEEIVEVEEISVEQKLEEMKRKLFSASTGNIVDGIDMNPNQTYFTTPAFGLNRILSGSLYKGVYINTHTGFVGAETCGKSSMMAVFLADAQKKGFLPVIIDAEGAWNKPFIERWGIDPNNTIRVKSMWVDEIQMKLTEWINAGLTNLAIVVDSIGALELKKMLKDGEGEGESKRIKSDLGRLQKEIKRMMKLIVSMTKFNNCVSFSAGHYYGNPTGYGEPEKIGGGNYYKLSCDNIITLRKYPIFTNPKGKNMKEKGKIIGNEITGLTLKNRFYPPFQEAKISINYENGIDEMAGLVELARELEMIIINGSWFSWGDIKAQGEAKFIEELMNNKELFLKELEERIQKTGYSNVNETLKNVFQEEPTEKEEE